MYAWLIVPLLAVNTLATSPATPAATKTPTQAMAERLKKLYANIDIGYNVTANNKRVGFYKDEIAQAKSRRSRARLKFLYANELLDAGQTDEAIEQYQDLLKNYSDIRLQVQPKAIQFKPGTKFKTAVKIHLGIAYMRKGEEQNCVHHHNSSSCIFPIKGKGIHEIKEGSRKALQIFSELLEEDDYYLDIRWLINIAYMTLGEYPEKVPAKFLFAPELFKSEREFPKFEDIAPSIDANVERGSGSVILDDFDNDGNLDLVVSSPHLNDQIHVLRHNGKKGKDFVFVDYTETSGLSGITDGKNIVQGDFDNDGCLDFFIVRGAYGPYPNSLIRNKCDGTFEDVTEKAGLLTFAPRYTAAWWDYNNDGWLDLIVPNSTGGGQASAIELWHNNRNGTFTNVGKKAGLNFRGRYSGVVWGDYDRDGRADVFILNLSGPSRLMRNEGPGKNGVWRFSDATAKAKLPADLRGRTTWFFDYDNDGYEDLLVSSGDEINLRESVEDYLGKKSGKPIRLFHNNGDGTFTDRAASLGLARTIRMMGANFGDLSNTGFLDVYFGTGGRELGFLIPNRMFSNEQGKKFLDVTTAGGFGHLQKGHGVAFGDIDNDGFVDVFSQMGGTYEGDSYWTALFKNPGNDNNWIRLLLRGTKSNRSAIGAKIKITITENGQSRSIYRIVSAGGCRGSNPLEQHLGLGKAKTIDQIDIFWPASNTHTILTKVKANQKMTITEGQP
jgi:hypothetical protein